MIYKTYKLIVTDRNGIVRKHMLREEPKIENHYIAFKTADNNNCRYIMSNLISFSVTEFTRQYDKPVKEKENEEE